MFSDGEVYAGTVADFTEVDPLIHRWDSLRTTQYDLKYLNGNHCSSFITFQSITELLFREKLFPIGTLVSSLT